MAKALTEGVVETLKVISGVPFGIASAISATGQDIVIALQMIGIKSALAVSERGTPPKKMGGGAIARA